MTLVALATVTGGCSRLLPQYAKEEVVTITTRQADRPLGQIDLVLYKDTPRHRENFLKLARSKFYDGTLFHRILDGFVIQGGDPNTRGDDPANVGQGGPGYRLPAEIVPAHGHVYGAVAAARQGDNVNPERESNGSQFYIVEREEGTPHLDGQYTVFGRVIGGMEVVERIAALPKDRQDRPDEDVQMEVKVRRMTRKAIEKKFGYRFSG